MFSLEYDAEGLPYFFHLKKNQKTVIMFPHILVSEIV